MKLAIMQPYFFPYMGYFQLINAVDKFIIYENLDYIVDGWMHKNKIQIKKGEISNITIHIMDKSSNYKINKTKLVKDGKWKRKILNAIKRNYCGASNYADFFPLFENILKADFNSIHNYNSNIIINICEYLNIETNIQFDNRNYLPLEKRLVSKYKEKKSQHNCNEGINKKTARVLEICKKEGANSFINAIGGKELYIKEEFRKFGIDLYFIKTEDVKYKQFSNSFTPNLSIIDVIMHCGKEQTSNLLNKFKLI